MVHPQKQKLLLALLLKAVLKHDIAFDKAFSLLVKKHGLSSREAGLLYRAFYKVIIYYHTIRFMSAYSGFGPRIGGLVEYLYARNFDVDCILDEVKELSHSLSPTLQLALLHGYPSWFVRDLHGKLPLNELENMLRSLNDRKRWVRVNTAKTSIEDAIECLERSGLRVKQHREFKEMLLLEDPFAKIGDNECLKEGLVVPQDISSYASTLALENVHGDFIDACSAPGIKLIQVLSRATITRTIAVDISEKRASVIPKLVNSFLGTVPNLIVVTGDSRTLHYNVKGAAVLVDSPCSNSGAIYADPVVKLHLSRKRLKRLQLVQKALLENCLKHAEKLFFVTCSVHPLEGEEVVDYLVEKYSGKIELLQLKLPYVDKGYMGYRCSSSAFRIYPHRVNGQGFFITALRVQGIE
ncbi:MAG: RsmB/NOP family class I SAM-dependent RNA methyltransferase [Desulfurococcaceae archaeon]